MFNLPYILSLARASKTLEEPMRLLREAENVAVKLPNVMKIGMTLIGIM